MQGFRSAAVGAERCDPRAASTATCPAPGGFVRAGSRSPAPPTTFFLTIVGVGAPRAVDAGKDDPNDSENGGPNPNCAAHCRGLSRKL